ncbi:MAG TPA: hypothetical protein VFX28_10390 [Methylomirabilota bacterium]|nr:hypothetical protein [Methylomirabilota bacterium]
MSAARPRRGRSSWLVTALLATAGVGLLVAAAVGWGLWRLARDLGPSSVTVANRSGAPVTDLALTVTTGGGPVTSSVGVLGPGESRRLQLDVPGEGALSVSFMAGGERRAGCEEYVEREGYEVRVEIDDALEVSCEAGLRGEG